MKKRMLIGLAATAALAVGATAGLAAVNQKIGIADTKFVNLYRADCIVCHVSDTVLVTRHHALIQSANKQCLDCHTQISDGTGGFYFADFRTCEVCHKTTPHHITDAAAARDCVSCHGKYVDNYNDGHTVPSYAPSDVTPMAGSKVVDDAQSTDPTKTIATGGCTACHVADLTATPRKIYRNADTHHGTGLQNCLWCHGDAEGTVTNIRTCETCHGIKSLHNVQVDSPNTANVGKVVSGGETPGWGHIGSNEDCWGCHGWYDKYDIAPETDAVVAWIEKLNTVVATAGARFNLVISGESFISENSGAVYTPKVEINGVTYTPVAYTNNSITVSVPTLKIGNYDVRVLKNGKVSNKASFSVKPALKVSTATASGTTATFQGVGFANAPLANTKSEQKVTINGKEAKIISWTDTKVVASVTTPIANKTPYVINTLFGPVSGTVTVGSTRR